MNRIWTPGDDQMQADGLAKIRAAFSGDKEAIAAMLDTLGRAIPVIGDISSKAQAKNLLDALQQVIPTVGLPVLAAMCGVMRDVASVSNGGELIFVFRTWRSGMRVDCALDLKDRALTAEEIGALQVESGAPEMNGGSHIEPSTEGTP